jgi:hypothetical protein
VRYSVCYFVNVDSCVCVRVCGLFGLSVWRSGCGSRVEADVGDAQASKRGQRAPRRPAGLTDCLLACAADDTFKHRAGVFGAEGAASAAKLAGGFRGGGVLASRGQPGRWHQHPPHTTLRATASLTTNLANHPHSFPPTPSHDPKECQGL